MRVVRLVVLMSAVASCCAAAEPVDMGRRTEELKTLKWGMFICWSFSTFSGKEWTPGVTDVSFFKATGCDTDQWARTAQEAGMGYILFLTKHHDGFCLWDTKTTDRKVTKTPLGRDVLAELRQSCDRHGVKLALYFSEGDWTWPDAVDGKGGEGGGGRNPEMKKAQLKELLTQYGPIEYIWFDHAVGDGGLSHAETIAFCKALQPGCFIGFNHGVQEGADIRLGELGRPGPLDEQAAAGPYMKDAPSRRYRLAEFTYPILPPHEGGAMWFYSLPVHDALCHPAEKLYRDYLGAVKFGNIFSLDVGPDYAGRLRDVDVRTLRQVGAMIRDKTPEQASRPFPGQKSTFNGFDRYDFPYQGRSCIVVTPKAAAPGKPWIWRARFWGHEPQTDLALLERGFHLVYMDVVEMFGSPQAVALWDAFYAYLTQTHGFAHKAVLEGMSRGGLYIYNWAAKNPDKVCCIYADAPVCDFKSWPGGKGAGKGDAAGWTQCLAAYGMTEEQALKATCNPIDNLAPLARAHVPLLHVVGDADDVVPVAENTAIVEQRYQALGGSIQVIHKPGVGHHPHSLKDPAPIVQFILAHMTEAAGDAAAETRAASH